MYSYFLLYSCLGATFGKILFMYEVVLSYVPWSISWKINCAQLPPSPLVWVLNYVRYSPTANIMHDQISGGIQLAIVWNSPEWTTYGKGDSEINRVERQEDKCYASNWRLRFRSDSMQRFSFWATHPPRYCRLTQILSNSQQDPKCYIILLSYKLEFIVNKYKNVLSIVLQYRRWRRWQRIYWGICSVQHTRSEERNERTKFKSSWKLVKSAKTLIENVSAGK